MKTKKSGVKNFSRGDSEGSHPQRESAGDTSGSPNADDTGISSASPGNPKKDRFSISFDVDESGAPDFAGMRESTKDRIREFLLDEKMREAFGAKVNGAPQVQQIHPAAIRGLYFTLGTIEAAVMPLVFKQIKPEIARQVFMYSDAELAALAGPTTAVLNKYADWFLKYQDEVALITMLSSLTIQKVQAAIILSKASQAKSEPEPKKEGDEPKVPVQ